MMATTTTRAPALPSSSTRSRSAASARAARPCVLRAALATQPPPPTDKGAASPAAPFSQRRAQQQRVLPLLASAVEAKASLYGYERLAGRSAMIGFAAACVIEVVGGAGVLSCPPEYLPHGVLGAVALAVLGASAAALASTARSPASLGARWREPVVASLTAVRRANAGVTPSWRLRGFDRAVDEVLRGLPTTTGGDAEALSGGAGADPAPDAAAPAPAADNEQA